MRTVQKPAPAAMLSVGTAGSNQRPLACEATCSWGVRGPESASPAECGTSRDGPCEPRITRDYARLLGIRGEGMTFCPDRPRGLVASRGLDSSALLLGAGLFRGFRSRARGSAAPKPLAPAHRPMRKRRAAANPLADRRSFPWPLARALLWSAAHGRPALFDARLARRNDGSAAVRSQGDQLQADRPSAGRLVGGAQGSPIPRRDRARSQNRR